MKEERVGPGGRLFLGSVFEPFAEGAAFPFWEGAGLGPSLGRRDGDETGGEEIHDVTADEGGFPGGGLRSEEAPCAHGRRPGFGRGGAFAFSFFTQTEEKVGDGNVDRADLVAGAAKGRGFG